MSDGSYKERYIEQHGERAYMEKMVRNSLWRAENPDKMAEYKTKRKMKSQNLLFIGDVHIGASTVDVDEIKALSRKYWRKNPIALLGDLCDLGLDRGMEYDQRYGPQQQLDIAEEIFKPLNIAAYVIGNHDARIFKKVGLTPFISMFGKPPENDFTVNGRRIYINHGRSAAENYFSEHQKYVKWKDSDVIALGHSHDLASISFLRGNVVQHLVRTGSFLGRPKYVVDAGFAPKIRGWVEYDTIQNTIGLMGLTEEGEVFKLQ